MNCKHMMSHDKHPVDDRVCLLCGDADAAITVEELRLELHQTKASLATVMACNDAMKEPLRLLREVMGMWAESETSLANSIVAELKRLRALNPSLQDEPEVKTIGRCWCQIEAGDSQCPTHGMESE